MNTIKNQLAEEEADRKLQLGSSMNTTSKYRGKAKEAFERGLDAGIEHAQYCDVSEAEYQKAYYDDTLGEILGEIVDNYRQFSPFEFTGSEFNHARNSDALWEAYDDGEYQGWIRGLEMRFGQVNPKTGCFDNADDASDVAVLDPTRPGTV